MKRIIPLGVLGVALFGLLACGDDASNADPVGGETIEESSSSESEGISAESGNSSADFGNGSSNSGSGSAGSSAASSSSVAGGTADPGASSATSSATDPGTSSATSLDTTKITYVLKRFDGPLANPHKGFTVPTEGTWVFSPEFEYGPYGTLKNRAWDLVTYGSGFQKWSTLNPQKGVYDWTELEKLLDTLANHNMGYALRVLPYTSSFVRAADTPEEVYDWTPRFVYEMGAKKITVDIRGTEYKAVVPVWDDSIYIQAAKDFAVALAQKYDGDPRIEYIDIRTFGNWGEWHTSQLLGSQMPNDDILKDMLRHYASVFKKTLLVLPSNGYGDVYTYALSLGIAKRDDGMIGIPGRPDTLARAYRAGLPTISENIAGYATMLNYNDIIPGGYLKWTPERWVDAITTAHLTYYVLDQDGDCGYNFYSDNKALADSMSKVIGYNFTVERAELLTVAGAANSTANETSTSTLNITMKNTGVAPCFFDLYLVAEFVDSMGAAIAQIGETVSIPKGTFKDNSSREFSFTYKPAAGESSVATQPGVNVALSLYESEEAFKAGKNPTVRFDNDGIQENKKLLLKSP